MLQLLFLIIPSIAGQALPGPFNIDPTAVSVSGLSAGGFAAVEFHVSRSSEIMGSAVVAGGPYFCARNNLNTALLSCMSLGTVSVPTLRTDTTTCVNAGGCDPVDNLRNDKIWLYSATGDTTVVPAVMRALEDYYDTYVDPENIVTHFTNAGAHNWPTDNFGNACGVAAPPYMSNCGFSTAKEALGHIYNISTKGIPPLKREMLLKNRIQFSQTMYFSGNPTSVGLHEDGYLYVPSACADGVTLCKLHISYHGCQMTLDDIQTTFVDNSGLNEVAEAHNIIIFYPQAKKSSFLGGNPNGCFDWWGYTNSNYARKTGIQNMFVKAVMDIISLDEPITEPPTMAPPPPPPPTPSPQPQPTGTPEPGDCLNCVVPHLDPSCENREVAECVCLIDLFCCVSGWDRSCVDLAISDCGC